MQSYVTVVLDAGRGENKFFCIDTGNACLRIGNSKDEALGPGALLLPLNDVSNVRKVSPNTLAVTSASMPPGTKPLTFQLPSASLADSWCVHLSAQPAGVPSREAKSTVAPVTTSTGAPQARTVANKGGSAASKLESSSSPTVQADSKPPASKIRFVAVLSLGGIIAAVFLKIILSGRGKDSSSNSRQAYAGGGMTLFGLILWLVLLGAFGLGALSGLLASKLYRERGKLTIRFQEPKISFSLKKDSSNGIIVDRVNHDCETLKQGVRIQGARVKRVGPRFQIKPETRVEDVNSLIAAHTERPLIIVFQTDDRAEIDKISEWYARRVSLVGFGIAGAIFVLFYSRLFPGSVGPAPTYVDPAVARVFDRPVASVAPKSVWSWSLLFFLLISGLLGLAGFYLYVRSLAVKVEKRRSMVDTDAAFSNPSSTRNSSDESPVKSENVVTEKPSIVPSQRTSVTAAAPAHRFSVTAAAPAHRTSVTATAPVAVPASPATSSLPAPPPLGSSHPTLETFAHLEKYIAMRKKGLSEFSVRKYMARDGVEVPPGFFELLADLPSGRTNTPSPPN